MADIGVVKGKLARLSGHRLGDFMPAIADIHAIKPGEGVKQPVAVTILDMDAGAAADDAVGAFPARVLGEMRGGMKQIVPVPLVDLVVLQHLPILLSRGRPF